MPRPTGDAVNEAIADMLVDFEKNYREALDGYPTVASDDFVDEHGEPGGVAVFWVPIELEEAIAKVITDAAGPPREEINRDFKY